MTGALKSSCQPAPSPQSSCSGYESCSRHCCYSARVDECCDGVDHRLERRVSFVCAHGNSLELCEYAEEVFDAVAAFAELWVDLQGNSAPRVLRYAG